MGSLVVEVGRIGVKRLFNFEVSFLDVFCLMFVVWGMGLELYVF